MIKASVMKRAGISRLELRTTLTLTVMDETCLEECFPKVINNK